MSGVPQGDAADLLIESGAVLSSSLDLPTTMGQVAELTVPRLADLCVIDMLATDGTISDVAVAAIDPEVAVGLEQLRRRVPIDPRGTHPVARVIAGGEPALLPEMSPAQLKSFAQDSEHARFMLVNGYRSAIVVPLLARERTLGAISVLRLGEHAPYDEQDLELVGELARRAALAIDNARLFGQMAQLERRQEAILANIAEAITVEDEHGTIVYANQAAAELLGAQDSAELAGRTRDSVATRFRILDEQARELDPSRRPGPRLLRGEEPEPLLVRSIVLATGEERWLIVRSSLVSDPDGGSERFVVNVYENITEVKRVQLAEAFMAQASRVLASSMDYGETLRRVARLAVPQLADWCAIDLLGEDGSIELAAVQHSDPAMVSHAERIRSAYGHSLEGPGALPEVIRTGVARLIPAIDADAMAAYARDSEHLEMMRSLGAVSAIIVPLLSAVQTIGAITLVSAESMRRLTEADMALAERLGRRAGTAVENARLYTERTRIAHVLQRALLPESLAPIPGAEVEARYRAAGELNEVGGDFYDVFRHDAGHWLLVIGDVVGKGARAAGVTALARHTLRAAAMSGGTPAEMMQMLHRALRLQPPGADLCTVCIVTVASELEPARVTVTLAGHPPPLLLGPHAGAAPVGRPGTLLGVLDPVRVSEVDLEMRPGQTLLLYTDGVLDAGRTQEPFGESGLASLCGRSATLALADLLERVEGEVLTRAGGTLRDDIALLGLRLPASS